MDGDGTLGELHRLAGAGARVGDDAAEDETGQGEPGHEPVVAALEEPDRQAGEDRGVTDPVEGRVEEGPPFARAPQQAGHDAVDRVGEDEGGDDEHADEQLPAGEEDEGTEADAEGADDRDGVGADAHPEQKARHRGEDPGDGGACVSIEHGGSSVTAPRTAAGRRTGVWASSLSCWRPPTPRRGPHGRPRAGSAAPWSGR